jgi:5-methylcytosine-specific restriction protein A
MTKPYLSIIEGGKKPLSVEEEIIAMQGIGMEYCPDVNSYEWRKQLFLDSDEWEQARQERLKIDNHKCCRCCATKMLTVDHVKPYWKYPQLKLDINNLQTLCWECHQLKYSNGDTADYRNL